VKPHIGVPAATACAQTSSTCTIATSLSQHARAFSPANAIPLSRAAAAAAVTKPWGRWGLSFFILIFLAVVVIIIFSLTLFYYYYLSYNMYTSVDV
jgi:hypothetical protein